MISRSAESCFWLCRHLERVETLARLLHVNNMYCLDVRPELFEAWYPIIVVTGQHQAFVDAYDNDACANGDLVQEYLIRNQDNPSSLFNSMANARENARIIRDILSSELWESINSFWLWLNNKKCRQMYDRNTMEFYEAIKRNCQVIHGLIHSSLFQEEAYHFMGMGMMLERANQTARIMDVKCHRIFYPTVQHDESVMETVQWVTLLKCCSANEAFTKRYNCHVNRDNVINFLLTDRQFPKTVNYALTHSLANLNYLQQLELKCDLNVVKDLTTLIKDIDTVVEADTTVLDVHKMLTHIVDATGEIGDYLHHHYFSPSLPFNEGKAKAQ